METISVKEEEAKIIKINEDKNIIEYYKELWKIFEKDETRKNIKKRVMMSEKSYEEIKKSIEEKTNIIILENINHKIIIIILNKKIENIKEEKIKKRYIKYDSERMTCFKETQTNISKLINNDKIKKIIEDEKYIILDKHVRIILNGEVYFNKKSNCYKIEIK